MPNTDKTILLPQLQRYDQKIKGWADNKFLTKADTPSLPKATATTLGGVKVGNGLNVTDDGILSAKTHGSETSITTSITATRDNTGTWNVVCNDTYDVIASWFDNYDRVFTWVDSSENSLRPFPRVFVELIKVQEGLIVSTPFTIQYVTPSNNPRVRTGMTTTALCQIFFYTDGSIRFQESYSEVDQYADATEFTNTVNEDISMLALKDGGITSAKLANNAVTAAKIASNAVTSDKITNGAVSSVKLASKAVTTDKIADGAITADKLASDVGVGGSIAEATEKTSGVVYAKVNPRIPPKSLGHVYSLQNSGLHIESINNGVINTEHLANYAVTAGKVANGAINAAKLANNAVTTNKIVNGAVTSVKLASSAVTADKIADGAITKAKLASDVGVGGDDVVTITFDGTTADKTWDEVDALYKAGKRLQVLSTEWGDEYILPLVSVMNNGNNLYNFSAHYMNGRRAEVNFWHDPSIPDSSHQKEIFSEISDYPAASKTSLGVVKVGDGLSITSDGVLKASGAGGSNLMAGHATIENGSKHSFGLWSVAVPKSSGSSSGKKFTINVFYNSSILIISDVQCTPSSNVSMTIEHSKVGKSGINRSGYIAFESSSPMYDSIKLAGQGVNIFETSEVGSVFCFAGLFFTV